MREMHRHLSSRLFIRSLSFSHLFVISSINKTGTESVRMKTCIEQLPIELWIEIFSHLEGHLLLEAFANLNPYFDRLLASDHLLFHVRLGKDSRNPREYALQPYWPDDILRRIVSLRPRLEHQTSHLPEFLRWHWTRLIQLKSLTIKVRGREIPHLCSALQQLPSLTSLSVEGVPNQILLEGILAASTLRVCRLEFSPPITPIRSDANYTSNVETLDITLQDDSNGSITLLLFSHMPKLQSIRMHNTDIYVKNREWIFFQPSFRLPELHTLKMRCSANYSTPIIFQSLHQNLPAIRRLHLNVKFDFINEHFFHSLIYHWWPILQDIEQISLFIRCHKYLMTPQDHMPTNFDEFRAILLAMNQQRGGSMRTEWIENFSLVSHVIQISICKFF